MLGLIRKSSGDFEISESGVSDLILVSDVIVAFWSSAVIDSYLAKVPTIEFIDLSSLLLGKFTRNLSTLLLPSWGLSIRPTVVQSLRLT